MDALRLIDDWPVDTAAVAVIRRDADTEDNVVTAGPTDRQLPLTSVTKPLVAYATLLAVQEGALGLDDAAGLDGSTVRHLLAHASGYHFEDRVRAAAPGTRRIYSNAGFEVLGEVVEAATGFPLADYLHEAVCRPLGMADTRLTGSPAYAAVSTVGDLAAFAAELLAPKLLAPVSLAAATTVQFPGLPGVLPGFGRQEPNDWGLGMELRDDKSPHWTGASNSPATFGHFGRSGTFLWVDPRAAMACVCLTDRDFGPWAAQAWPELSDAVLAETTGTEPTS